MATRRKFSLVYKYEAVQLAQSSDRSVSQVAREPGINPDVLTRWCREARQGPG
jgi:transposase